MTDFNNMGNTVARTVDQAEASVQKAYNQASDAARPVFKQLADSMSSAIDRLETTGESLKVAPQHMTRSLRMAVREQPLAAVGVALAAGYLLNWALRRR